MHAVGVGFFLHNTRTTQTNVQHDQMWLLKTSSNTTNQKNKSINIPYCTS